MRVLSLYAAVAIMYVLANSSHIIWIDISVFLAIGLLYIMLVPFFIKKSVQKRVNDILAKRENQHVLDEAEVIISSGGIVDKDTVSESRYAWDAIVKFAETEDAYYLYTSSYYAIVIPKRAIQAKQDEAELKKLFNKYLPLQA